MRISEYPHSRLTALVRAHKALGDETRLRIANLLARRGELCVCDLEAILQISQSKASRHLGHLKRAGVVEDRRDRSWVYYRLAREPPPPVQRLVRELAATLAEDEVGLGDLARAKTLTREPSCQPDDARARSARPIARGEADPAAVSGEAEMPACARGEDREPPEGAPAPRRGR